MAGKKQCTVTSLTLAFFKKEIQNSLLSKINDNGENNEKIKDLKT